MPETFTETWRAVRLHVPTAPHFLVQAWVQESWKKLARSRNWSFLRGELVLTINAARVLTVGVTQGSTTVTSAGLFLTTDAGRQFRVGTYPVFTIQTVV